MRPLGERGNCTRFVSGPAVWMRARPNVITRDVSGGGAVGAMVAESMKAGDAISAAIEHALQAPPHRLTFVAGLEARYRDATQGDRLRTQRAMCMLGVTLFLAFVVEDALVVPDVLGLGVMLRATCFIAALPMVAMLQPGTPAWLTDTLVASFVVPGSLTVAALFASSHSADRVAYLHGLAVLVTLANTCLQQRFRFAAASSLAVLAIAVAAMQAAVLPDRVQYLQVGLLLSTIILTLGVAHRLERQARRAWLFGLRDSLQQKALQRTNLQLAHLAERDSLTGLTNRRALERHLQASWAAAALGGQSLAAIMIDVDWFKRYNDAYGHPAGDACLRAVGQAIREQIQPDDVAGRYGGEEFLVILGGADASQAHAVAERIRVAVQELGVPHATSTASHVVTVSLGLACAHPEPGMIAADLLQAADAALYAAKQAGRARICLATAMTA